MLSELTANVTSSSFRSTTAAAGSGGAVSSHYALSVWNSTFASVRASLNGGALAATGPATVSGCAFSYALSGGRGGGLFSDSVATVVNCTFAWAMATGVGSAGGAVFSSLAASVSASSFQTTSASDAGGALFGASALAVTGCSFANVSTGDGGTGGAVAAAAGALSVASCAFSTCWAGRLGGAVYYSGTASVALTGCSFSGTRCTAAGCDGGAVNSPRGALSIANSSFAVSSATNDGGMVYAGAGAQVTNTTFSGGFAGGKGGALFAGGAGVISISAFSGCSASLDGGAVFGLASGNQVTSSSFSTCSSALGDGGALAGPTAGLSPSSPLINQALTVPAFTVRLSTFSTCSALRGAGGALSVASLTSSGNSFTGNSAESGGALAVPSGGWLAETGSSFLSNTATVGGCLWVASPLLFQRVVAALVGSTFTSCQALGPGARGGAVVAEAASLAVSACAFSSNRVDASFGATEMTTCLALASGKPMDRGGALQALDSSITVDSSNFTTNTAGAGGALAVAGAGSTAFVSNSILWGNAAARDGGAVDVDRASNITLVATQLVGNSAGESGGGVSLKRVAAVSLLSVTAAGNAAVLCGGAVRTDGALTVAQSTFTSNYAGIAGGVLFTDMASLTSPAPPRPPCFALGTCVALNNSAVSYGPVTATNVSVAALTAAAAARTGTPLLAFLTLLDGYGQQAVNWPLTVITVTCAAPGGSLCPGLAGDVKIFYDGANQPVATVVFAAPSMFVGNATYPLLYAVTSPLLSTAIYNTTSVFIPPCLYLEEYSPDEGLCVCRSSAARDPSGVCVCVPGSILGADLDSCLPCPPGTHSAGNTCVPCEPGTVAPTPGFAQCEHCPQHASDRDRLACACNVGAKSSMVGPYNGTCEQCPRDFYQVRVRTRDRERPSPHAVLLIRCV